MDEEALMATLEEIDLQLQTVSAYSQTLTYILITGVALTVFLLAVLVAFQFWKRM